MNEAILNHLRAEVAQSKAVSPAPRTTTVP